MTEDRTAKVVSGALPPFCFRRFFKFLFAFFPPPLCDMEVVTSAHPSPPFAGNSKPPFAAHPSPPFAGDRRRRTREIDAAIRSSPKPAVRGRSMLPSIALARLQRVWQAHLQKRWQTCQNPFLRGLPQGCLLGYWWYMKGCLGLQCLLLASALLCPLLASALLCPLLDSALLSPLLISTLQCPLLQGQSLQCPCCPSGPKCPR